ncbi:MAG: DUF3616 domain-containing protein [Phycisphaerae bacterium]|nr:DUF3616 domain-containing protein [Phycisphaerae bacterium]
MNNLAIVKHLSLVLILIASLIVVGCDDKSDDKSVEQASSAAQGAPARNEQVTQSENPADVSKNIARADVYPLQSDVEPQPERKVQVYRRSSDASAAVALGEDMFVMADDENNILRVYKMGGDLPVYSYDMSNFLETERDHPEADIEGATKIGERVYWITSHGRNKDGKVRSNRYRFFATDVEVNGGKVSVQPVGKPCKTLLRSLLSLRATLDLGLHKAAGFGLTSPSKKELKKLAPKEGGLNIEGLCASPDGRTIYIGFRNPRPIDKSTRRAGTLVVPLNNPADVIEKGDVPVFGEPILWDFAGLGARSMEYSAFHKAYFIVAGAFDGTPEFALYRWSGRKDEQPALVQQMSQSNFSPEALIPFESSEMLLLLSDDGTLPVRVSDASQCAEDELNDDGTCPNKFLLDANKKTFRAIRLIP